MSATRPTTVARLAALALLAVVLAACQWGPSPGQGGNGRDQATAALARWADAVAAAGGQSSIVLVGEPTGQVGDWEAAVGDNDKRALMSGLLVALVPQPTDTPPDADVQWPDGTTTTVPVMSAAAALAAAKAGSAGPCDGCVPLQVMAARLTTGPITTGRGPAVGPLWEFTIQGTAVKVTHVAIAHAIVVTPPPWDPEAPAIGPAIESATGPVGGTELTVAFVGAPDAGNKPCGEDYTTEAVESDLAVVVIVTAHRAPALGGCSLVGAMRTATVQLAHPLGDRAVLEAQQGLPVPVVLTP